MLVRVVALRLQAIPHVALSWLTDYIRFLVAFAFCRSHSQFHYPGRHEEPLRWLNHLITTY